MSPLLGREESRQSQEVSYSRELLSRTDAFSTSLQDAQRIVRQSGMGALGNAYCKGTWDCGPEDLTSVLESLIPIAAQCSWSVHAKYLLHMCRDRIFNLQAGKRAFEVGTRHYDLGNELFAAMLDTSMSYTSGLWSPGSLSLEAAQIAKLKRICECLDLKPGMTVLDIGCGWGNFARYAAREYGVSVVGLTVSKEQARGAQQRCIGLPVEIVVADYRTWSGNFDRVVSIEMIEAVGRKNVPLFFQKVEECLRPGGRFALQAISGATFTRGAHPALNQYVLWLLQHIFPNGYLPRMDQLTAPRTGRLMLDSLYNMKGDYQRTLHAWRSNFEESWPTLSRSYDEEFRRMWRFYLCGCEAMFRQHLVSVYQLTYSRHP